MTLAPTLYQHLPQHYTAPNIILIEKQFKIRKNNGQSEDDPAANDSSGH